MPSTARAIASAAPGCPVCGAPCTNPHTHEYTAQQAAAHFCPKTRNPDRYQRLVTCIRHLWSDGTCKIFICPSCGFGFGYPFVGGDDAFYGILHEQAGYPTKRWEYGLAKEIGEKAFAPGGNVLDMGAGYGLFLKTISPSWKLYATEGSPTTRAKLAAEGINVFSDLRDAAETMVGQFQLVTAFQVIEHIAEYREVFGAVRRLLCPGGAFVLSVPNRDDMDARERITHAQDMPPNHINKWTANSISLALRRAGFDAVESQVAPPGRGAFEWGVGQRMIADASEHPHSIAGVLYQVRNTPVRRMLLRGWGVFVALRLLPHYGLLSRSNNLVTVARVR